MMARKKSKKKRSQVKQKVDPKEVVKYKLEDLIEYIENNEVKLSDDSKEMLIEVFEMNF